jgi:hypothetical protein
MTILGAVLVLLIALVAPSGGIFRVVAAGLMVVIIVGIGISRLVKYRTIPPDPEVTDVGEYGLKYVCSMCGLELKIEVAARDKAPTHCGEPMVLERTGGRPPLRPI